MRGGAVDLPAELAGPARVDGLRVGDEWRTCGTVAGGYRDGDRRGDALAIGAGGGQGVAGGLGRRDGGAAVNRHAAHAADGHLGGAGGGPAQGGLLARRDGGGLAGEAQDLRIAAGAAPTCTVRFCVTGPPGPLAVRVYVVVCVGETETEPVCASTEPTLGEMLAPVALVIVQLRWSSGPAGWRPDWR